MLIVATVPPDAITGPAGHRGEFARRSVATLARLARVHEIVVVADWPDRGPSARSLVDALTEALPWREIVLVAARADRRPRSGCNVPTVRRLIDDGAVVVCLAGGPGRDRTAAVGATLAAALPADRVVRLTGAEPLTAPRPAGRVLRPAGAARPWVAGGLVRTGTPAARLGG
jgi:hypothetical protein